MDISTIIGLLLGIGGLIFAFIMEAEGDVTRVSALFVPSAMMIIVFGTFGALLVAFPMATFMNGLKAVSKTFFAKEQHPMHAIQLFTRLAEKARREGLLSLEEEEGSLDDDFVKKGIQLVVDGTDPELLTSIMEIEITQMMKRHEENRSVFEQAGGFSPTMGIIGTVMGLINVLSTGGEDPAELVHGIAVAFIATLWGVLLANVVWLPLGNKLKMRSEEEVVVRRIMLEGLLSVQAGENPRVIQEKLYGFLPPKHRQVASESDETAAARPAAAEA